MKINDAYRDIHADCIPIEAPVRFGITVICHIMFGPAEQKARHSFAETGEKFGLTNSRGHVFLDTGT